MATVYDLQTNYSFTYTLLERFPVKLEVFFALETVALQMTEALWATLSNKEREKERERRKREKERREKREKDGGRERKKEKEERKRGRERERKRKKRRGRGERERERERERKQNIYIYISLIAHLTENIQVTGRLYNCINFTHQAMLRAQPSNA